MTKSSEEKIISQSELDKLLHLDEVMEQSNNNPFIKELKQAILAPGKLKLFQWHSLRSQIHEIEALVPHIDLIIKLKKENKDD
ncbi:hypothetical protein SG34_007805 [Thalassomonas viridans]|uniref:Uncharacterized protein n=1 Tax=Thalassomonas viridans TaxID=137584 RepID=A0AAF0CAQ7_9GAMM|nr:hypothetical protein [Thalassomonas viridans]WDE06796.1 hypothetical protein SG34_007805 [Thalassomonas viridans]